MSTTFPVIFPLTSNHFYYRYYYCISNWWWRRCLGWPFPDQKLSVGRRMACLKRKLVVGSALATMTTFETAKNESIDLAIIRPLKYTGFNKRKLVRIQFTLLDLPEKQQLNYSIPRTGIQFVFTKIKTCFIL